MNSQKRFDTEQHVPVMLTETLEMLKLKRDGLYVDATFGRGGHADAILAALGAQGRLLVFDRDASAVQWAIRHYEKERRVTVIHSGFVELRRRLNQLDIAEGTVDGIVFDLGVSSPQLDDAQRGFSFLRDGPLDMRMDTDTGLTADQWINGATEEELMHVIAELGEERFARRVARAIVGQRPVHTTRALADLIENAIPRRTHVSGHHPATRSFQAIRMHINDELGQIRSALPQAFELLNIGGRLVTISFHSLEDKIVKAFIFKLAKQDKFPPDMPVTANQQQRRARAVGGLKRPSTAEIDVNPRARSARLRTLEKLRTDLCAA